MVTLQGIHMSAQQQDLSIDSSFNLQLDQAIVWQQKADSLYHISIGMRKQASGMYDPFERGKLQGRIVEIEDSMRVFRERADRYFSMPGKTGIPFILLDTVLHGISIYRYNDEHEYIKALLAPEPGKDTTGAAANGDSLTVFSMLKSSPYTTGNPFEPDFVPPEGPFYRIQLAVYSREIEPGHFGGLFPVTTESIGDTGMTRYFVGKFRRLNDAEPALSQVRAAGYPDAFIIAYFNGIKSTPEKVSTLEEE